MKKILYIFLLLFSTQTFSQNWQWAKQPYGTNVNGDDHGYDIDTDVNGNSYLTGKFQDTMTFGTITLHTPTQFDSDIYIAKYDANGNVVWVRQAGGEGYDEGYGVSIDNLGNCFVTGIFQDTAVFGNDTVYAPNWTTNTFIAKYDTSGNFKWVKHSSALETNGNYGFGITNDILGNVFVTGCFQDSLVFDSFSFISSGMFIAKFNSLGNCMWAKKVSETNSSYPSVSSNRIAVDIASNSYITGTFSDTLRFVSDTIIALGRADAFIAKYDINGNFLWARKMGGSNISYSDEGYDIVVDTLGNIYSIGLFYDNAIFDTINLNSFGNADIFISKWNTNGNIIWAKKAGGTSTDYGFGIELNNNGKIYVTGLFQDTAIFGSNVLISTGFDDLFIALYDINGNNLNAMQSLCSSSGYLKGLSISSDTSDNVYVTGIFQGSVSFGSTTLTSTGGCDIFVAKLSPKETGIINNPSELSINLFPNPFHDFCTLTFENPQKEKYILTLYDINGRLLRTINTIITDNLIIKRENLTTGFYFFQLRTYNQIIATGKLIIE